MNKNSWKIKLLNWWAVKVCLAPFTVNYTPPQDNLIVAIGFSWYPDVAQKMSGDYAKANSPQKLTRAYRRAINRASKKAADKAVKQ